VTSVLGAAAISTAVTVAELLKKDKLAVEKSKHISFFCI
jgi:hypothetical protein